MTAPRLNPLADPVLCGLLYRALAADTDGTGAGLTQHHLEQLQAENTKLAQEISTLRAKLAIQEQRALDSAHNARQAQLDLQLFEKQNPTEPRRRRLFGPRLTPQQREAQVKRTELSGIAAVEGAEAAKHKELAAEMGKHLAEQTARQEAVNLERSQDRARFQSELAAHVLGLASAGGAEEARLALADARTAVRGDLMVAVLMVLTELLCTGTDAALVMLGELKPLFRQHDDPLPRVLGTLIGLRHGGAVTRREVGAFSAGSFSTPAFNRLYQLVKVLAALSHDEDSLQDDPFAATLWVLRELVFLEIPPEGWQQPPVEFIAQWAATAEPVARVIAQNVLLNRDAVPLLATAAGIDPAAITPPRRHQDRWPELSDLLADTAPAWPAALNRQWWTLSACHVLLGVRDHAPPPLFEQWLAESYNWPKDDMYWWTLARLNNDPALLRNIKRDSTQATTIPL